MNRAPSPFHLLAPALVLGAVALSGCGAGSDTGAGQGAPGADAAAYAATLEYCGSTEPSGNAAQPGGWELSSPYHSTGPAYDVNALVSVGGADSPASLAPSLQVEIHDYRNVAGSFIPAAYFDPAWKMGVHFLPTFAPKSAACVASLAKLVSISKPAPGLPGAINPGAYTLSWRSKWSAAVPVESLPGKIVDGFEFVGNFTPQGARVFFVLAKRRHASVQGASICHLPPAAIQWDCTAPEVHDRGSDWQLTRAIGKAGVYVVVAP